MLAPGHSFLRPRVIGMKASKEEEKESETISLNGIVPVPRKNNMQTEKRFLFLASFYILEILSSLFRPLRLREQCACYLASPKRRMKEKSFAFIHAISISPLNWLSFEYRRRSRQRSKKSCASKIALCETAAWIEFWEKKFFCFCLDAFWLFGSPEKTWTLYLLSIVEKVKLASADDRRQWTSPRFVRLPTAGRFWEVKYRVAPGAAHWTLSAPFCVRGSNKARSNRKLSGNKMLIKRRIVKMSPSWPDLGSRISSSIPCCYSIFYLLFVIDEL